MSIFVQWENNKTPLNAENLNVINDVARQLGEDVAHLSDVVVDIDENFSAKVQNELTEVKSSINTINETTSELQQQTSSNNTNITNIQKTIVDNNSALEEKINTNKNNLTTLQSVVNDNKTELDGKITTNKNNLNTLQQNVNNINSTLDGKIATNKNKLDSLEQNINNVNSTLDGKIATNKNNISNIQNSLLTGQYTSYSGTNLTCNDTLSSKTSNMVIKGQTYQNLIDFNKLDKNFYNYSNGIVNNIRDGVDDRVWDIMNNVSDLLKQNTDYTFIVTNLTPNTQFQYGFGTNVNTTGFNGVGDTKVLKFTTSDLASVSFKAYKTIEAKTSVQIKVMLLEGDWTNKEVPNTYISGIESVGEKENNKISILSNGKNLCPINKISIKQARYVITKTPIKLKPNTYYSISSNAQLNVLVTNTLINPVPVEWNQDVLYSQIVADNKGHEYGIEQRQNSFLNKDWKYAYITTWIKNENGVDIENLMFCEGQNDFDFVSYKEDKKEILIGLDGGLKSLPDGTCDTIEQKEDGIYLVQRIGKTILNGSEDWWWNSIWDEQYPNVLHACVTFPLWKLGQRNAISDKFVIRTEEDRDLNKQEIHYHTSSNNIYINLAKSLLSTQDLDGFKAWLQANPVAVYYELATPIETKLDTKDINVETFDDLTYILTNNNIQPELEFKIPSNLGALIQNNAKKINELFKLIDELIIPQLTTNTSNIAVLQITK